MLAVAAVVVALVVASRPPLQFAVTADIGGGIQLAQVNLGVAVTVLLAFAALCRAVAAVCASAVVRWVEWSQVSGVTVFLVAQLNGVHDVAALVAVYALTSGATLFLVLHERGDASRWPFSFGAAVAIVPWGIIAFYQVGSIVVGQNPTALVRVTTIVLLVAAGLYWYAGYTRSHRAQMVVVSLSTIVFAGLTVAAITTATAVAN